MAVTGSTQCLCKQKNNMEPVLQQQFSSCGFSPRMIQWPSASGMISLSPVLSHLPQPQKTTTTHTERFWKVCSGVKQTLLTQSFKYGKMQKYIYQPVFGLLAVRSFRVAFFLFRSSAVLSCRRISLILNKYNIVYKELLNYFKDGGLYYFFIY